jgi:hypothetical protein
MGRSGPSVVKEGCWAVGKERKDEMMDDATFLYPTKAAAGPCTRLTRIPRPALLTVVRF